MRDTSKSRRLLPLLALLLAACAAPTQAPAPVVDTGAASASAQRRAEALAGAEAALARGDAAAAARLLEQARPVGGDQPSARYQRAVDALAELRTDPVGQALARAQTRIDRMPGYDAIAGVDLLADLEGVPSSRLAALATGDTALAQWSALALSVRRDLVARTDLLEAANAWEAQHPGHPVGAAGYMELCWQYGQRFRPPARIAVLLPAGGPLGSAAQAIRDGLLMAWLDHPAASRLDFIPPGDEPAAALEAYQRAARDGYDWVIGPLRRESTQQIAALPAPPVPVLLLNDPDDTAAPAPGAHRQVYSLSLSQQQEARALAQQVLAQDFRRAIVLAVDDSWGRSVEQGFAEAYLAGGGEVVATERFAAVEGDHSTQLTQVLRIEDSRQRKSRLQGALGMPLEFEPSRRDDFDVIVIAADPALGRQLKPQLRFFDAGDKPMYAMSRIYSGQPDPGADQDLNGIRFAGTQAALPGGPQQASGRAPAFAALQSLGADAWGVLPWLELLRADPDLEYPGATGRLRILADGSLYREPLWLEFSQGRPAPIGVP